MSLELRRLTENELELLMNWRMRPDISAMMFNTVKLTMEGQKKWFDRIKNSETEIRWIVWNNGKPVGSMYFVDIDRQNSRCESGWFLAEKDGMDLASVIALQRNTYDYAFDVLKLNRIYGYVIDDNKNAVRLVEMCGVNNEGLLVQHILKDSEFHDVYVVGITKSHWQEKKKSMKYSHIPVE